MKSKLLGRSKVGSPVLYETGGSINKNGIATVICDSEGKPVTPIYIIGKKVKPNSISTVFFAVPGYCKVTVSQKNGEMKEIVVEKLVKIDKFKGASVGRFEILKDTKPFQNAIQTAFAKACTKRCFASFYHKGQVTQPLVSIA